MALEILETLEALEACEALEALETLETLCLPHGATMDTTGEAFGAWQVVARPPFGGFGHALPMITLAYGRLKAVHLRPDRRRL